MVNGYLKPKENYMFGKFAEKLAGGGKKLTGKTDLLEGICAMASMTLPCI